MKLDVRRLIEYCTIKLSGQIRQYWSSNWAILWPTWLRRKSIRLIDWLIFWRRDNRCCRRLHWFRMMLCVPFVMQNKTLQFLIRAIISRASEYYFPFGVFLIEVTTDSKIVFPLQELHHSTFNEHKIVFLLQNVDKNG